MGPSRDGVRVAVADPRFVERASARELDDWWSYFEPTAVAVAGSTPSGLQALTLRRELGTRATIVDPSGDRPGGVVAESGATQLYVAGDLDDLRDLREMEGRELSTGGPTYVLSALLSLDVDTTTLSTTLLGVSDYREALAPDDLDGDYVHVSAALPAGYRRTWEGLPVVGGGAEAGSADEPLVALDCRADGRVLAHRLKPSNLGLRAVDGVGTKRARALADAGITTREDVLDADVRRLVDVEGIGRPTAERIRDGARAVARGEVVRTDDGALPAGDPLYVDIETDGLSPTTTWLVGVLDGTSADGEYHSFLQRDPDDEGAAIRAFLEWYRATAEGRPVVAYNGWSFDFPTLADHVLAYCPEYEPVWEGTYRFDPYEWAVRDGNALLPGQTNRLEDVAAALGYEREQDGVTGAAVARAYQDWMVDRSPATEPDWERFDAYCEDDVRALAVVYEALQGTGRIESTQDRSPDVTETTTQGSLSDF